MAKVKAGIRIDDAKIDEVEALWHDSDRWTGFVDGFGHVERTEGEWPQAGARVVWLSRPGGRGRVVEKARSYEPGALEVVDIEDAEILATQTLTYKVEDGGVLMSVTLDFRRKDASPLAQVIQTLFVRSAMKASLRRTLASFRDELIAERELATG